MKKLISTVIVLALILSLSVTVFAVDTVKVYCKAPADWETCHVHWWNSEQGSSAWPGDAMTKGSDGIWYAEIPADAANLLFNKEGDDGKTADLTMPTDGNLQFNIEANTWSAYGAEVEVVIAYYVAGSVGLCGVDWNPGDAANKMTEGENGIYTKVYTNVEPSAEAYELKVTNGTWNQSWGDPNNTETGNCVVVVEETSDVVVTFDSVNAVVTVEVKPAGSAVVPSEPVEDPSEPVEDPSEPVDDPSVAPSEPAEDPSVAPSNPSVAPSEPSVAPSEPAVNGVTVTATVPSDWTNVRIWAWQENGDNAFAGSTWPGNPMTSAGGNKYTITLPVTFCDRIIINADVNGAVLQTKNLNIVAGKNVDVVIGSVIGEGEDTGKYDAEVTYNGSVVVAPVDPSLKGEYRVVGSTDWMGNWDPANAAGLMTEVSDGVYEITFQNVPVGNYEFKITKDGTWDNAWGEGGKGGQNNIPMVVSVAGDVTVQLNVGTGALSYKTAASGEWVPVTGDMGIAAVCAALLFASAGLVCAVSKKKEF